VASALLTKSPLNQTRPEEIEVALLQEKEKKRWCVLFQSNIFLPDPGHRACPLLVSFFPSGFYASQTPCSVP
jgi:hypothetical protein